MAKKYVDEFYLYNIKNVKEFNGIVKGKHFALAGPNGSGKTTRFQGIRRLLAMMPDSQKPDVWITQGEHEGEMWVKLGADGEQYLVQEKFTSNTRSRISFFKVSADGIKDELKPAQDRLRQIFGNVIDFTPLIDMSGRDQFNFLKRHLKFDTSGYEANRDAINDQRKKARNKKAVSEAIIENTLKDLTQEDLEKYRTPKSVDAILKKKVDPAKLYLERDYLEQREKNLYAAEEKIKQIDAQIKRLEEEKKLLQIERNEMAKVQNEISGVKQKITAASENNKKVDEELHTISEHNMKVAKVNYYKEKKADLEKEKDSFDDLTRQIKELDISFGEALAALPFDEACPGLKLVYHPADAEEGIKEEKGLYIRDLPFNRAQISYSELVKTLIKLSVSLNPEGLNFVYISDWDLLDNNNKQELINFAETQGNIQLGVEKVDDNKTEVGVEFIEVKPKAKKAAKPRKKL